MPKLVQVYIRQCLIGLALAVVFTAALIGFNVANLRHLVMTVGGGWIAVVMLVVFNTIVFAGAQFGMTIMRMAEDTTPPDGGTRARAKTSVPATGLVARPVPVKAHHR